MKSKLFLFCIILSPFWLWSQSNEFSLVSTAGDFFQTENFTLSWSLGEVISETYSGTNFILIQGFQQPDQLPNAIVDSKGTMSWSVHIYPNPCRHFVYVEMKGDETQSWLPDQYEIYDIQGKRMVTGLITEPLLMLDMSSFKNSVYGIRVFSSTSQENQTLLFQKIE